MLIRVGRAIMYNATLKSIFWNRCKDPQEYIQATMPLWIFVAELVVILVASWNLC